MRVTGSRVYSRPQPIPKMPPGLVELMEGLTRDVLKNNPPDVYEFCADHMRKLLEIRDGPSINKKLSLEQKILRAQEKVKKRAEQRWRKFKEEVVEKNVSQSIPDTNPQQVEPSVVDINIKQTASKPLHHEDDLLKISEIEISCESGNNVIQDEHGLLQTEISPENISKGNLAPGIILSPPHEESLPKVENIEIIQELTSENKNQANIKQTNEKASLVIDPLKTAESQKTALEYDNDEKVIESISDNHNENTINECDANIDSENKENTVVSENVFEQDSINKVNVEENTEIQENYAVELKIINSESSSGIIKGTSLISDNKVEISKAAEDEVEVKSPLDSHNDTDVENVRSSPSTPEHILMEENKFKSNDDDNILPIAGTEITDNLANSGDLEKVLNEAIENIKRKDSSANDSLKDPNVFNEEESDVSESSNYAENNITISQPKENTGPVLEIKDVNTDSFSLVESNDAVIYKNTEVMDIEKSEHNNIQENIKDDDSSITSTKENTLTLEKFGDSKGTQVNEIAKDIPSLDLGETQKSDNANTMDLETAAVTIQKVFRTFLFKSRASTFDDTVNEGNNLSDEEEKKDERQFLPSNINIERRPLGLSRMDTVLQTVNEEKSLSLSTDDSSLSSAATIIQAHVRGFLVRNKLHSSKTTPNNSLAISNEPSGTSVDGDTDQNKNKTILNIHIVPEGGNYLSRDESIITSMELSLDGSPPSSVNLHPLGTSERRKQLKREDAIQSVSPPSNNSGKLSEDIDSIKELTINGSDSNVVNQDEKVTMASLLKDDSHQDTEFVSFETTPTNSLTVETVLEDNKTSNTELLTSPEPEHSPETPDKKTKSLTKQSSDEMDVVTPYKENTSSRDETQLLHSGEFHDAALPTKVSRSDTPVVSEFKNVLVYFLFWNN